MKKIWFAILTSNLIIYLILWQKRNSACESRNLEKSDCDFLNRDSLNKLANKLLSFPKITTSNSDTNRRSSSQNPILVIFTTFKATSEHHRLAHRLIISNWNSFGGAIKPVLFANLSRLGNISREDPENVLVLTALEKGWDVLELKSANSYGTPYLRPMYEEVFKRYNASFYGYANGDLLFTDELLKSLEFVESILQEKLSNNVLLVGQRTDVQLFKNLSSVSSNNTKEFNSSIFINVYENYFNKSNLPELAKRGVLIGTVAIDYFFFSRENSTFNWSAIADVVVGRRAYDQYLVAMAIRFNVNTIDLSQVVLATHLSKPGIIDTGFHNVDTNFNLKVIGNFPYNDGQTSTTRYLLQQNVSSSEVLLTERKKKVAKD